MIKLCLVGARGRMGRQFSSATAESSDLSIVCGISRSDGDSLGSFPIYEGVPAESFDVVVDFSSPQGVIAALEAAKSRNVPLVVGTTGIDQDALEALRQYAAEQAVVVTSNFSIGMNTMFWLASQLGERLNEGFDAEVFEVHHRHKKDAPSGSALTIASNIARARKMNPAEVLVTARGGKAESRSAEQVGVAALRGGDVAGEHTMYFFGEGERIEVTHRVSDRKIFAQGAVIAAKWIVTQPAGLYSMMDVLGFS